jgi:hypothetical protein
MKLNGSHAVIALMALVIAVLSWTLVYFARDELSLHGDDYEDEIETAATAGVENGRAVVRVSAESQAASGIVTRALATAESSDFVKIYGAVVNIQPLLEQRGRYLAASGEARALDAAVAAAEAEFRRMERLYKDDRNVSEQALRNAEARYRADVAQRAAARAAVTALRDGLSTTWGPAVTGWATNPDSRQLQALLERRSQLIQLAFPYELPASAARGAISIAPVSGRGRLAAARFVSDSPQVDVTLPGQTFFYIVDDASLRAGTRVIARVDTGREKVTGVRVPNEAVVWHAGKSWIYLRQDGETFARHEVSATRDLGDGWFNRSADLAPGREVVVSGAQLLLSEELKFQIRNENED